MKKIIVISVLIVACIVTLIILPNQKPKQDVKATSYFIYDENESQYIPSSSIPVGKYLINNDNTTCENGGKVGNYNSDNGTIEMNVLGQDVCYIYYDRKISDLEIDTSLYNPTKYSIYENNVICNEENKSFNYNNWSINIDLNNKSSCIVTSSPKDDYPVASDYLIDLLDDQSIVESGNGLFVNDNFLTVLDDAHYLIKSMEYLLISGSPMTVADEQYTGTSTTMYGSSMHKFTATEDGYYRVCYHIPSSKSTSYGNRLTIYALNSTNSAVTTISSNLNYGADKDGCYDYGALYTDDFVYISNYFFDNNITVWFEKTTDYNSTFTGYRYEGKNPNNYVWFNDEYWQIIGVFNEDFHSISNTNLIKIIKSEILGSFVWGAGNNTFWNSSPLKNYLNTTYYDELIKNEYKNMIKSVTWNIMDSNQFTTSKAAYILDTTKTKTLSDTKIGLMYISDYAFASSVKKCSRNVYLNAGGYNSLSCAGTNWIYGNGAEWTISRYNTISYGYYVSGNGTIYSNYNTSSFNVRPTLYLDEDVFIIKGDGSPENPYVFGI